MVCDVLESSATKVFMNFMNGPIVCKLCMRKRTDKHSIETGVLEDEFQGGFPHFQ